MSSPDGQHDSSGEFARGGGGKRAATTKAGKVKAARAASKKGGAGGCGANGPGGGGFQKGNTCGGGGSGQRAAADRVKARLAAKSNAAKAEKAAKDAGARVATTKSGPGAMVARSKQAASKAAQVKAAREKAALDRKQARNKKARERYAAKKEAAKSERTAQRKPGMDRMVAKSKAAVAKGAEVKADRQKAARAGAIGKMVAKSKGASDKAGAKNAEAKRAATEQYNKVVDRKTPASPKQINKVAKALESASSPSKRAAAKVKAKADAAAGPIDESKTVTYGGRKELVMSRTDRTGPTLTVRQGIGGKGYQVFEGDARAAGSGRGVRELGTFDSLGAAKKFARGHLTGAPTPAAATPTPKEELSQAIAAIRKDKGLSRTKMARQIKNARQTIRDTTDENQARLDVQNARAERRRAEKARQPRLPFERAERAAANRRMTDRSKAAVAKGAASPAAKAYAEAKAAGYGPMEARALARAAGARAKADAGKTTADNVAARVAAARAAQKAAVKQSMAGARGASDADRAALARAQAERAAARAAAPKVADTRSLAERYRAAGIQPQSLGTGKGTFRPAGPLPTPKANLKAAGRGTAERSVKAAAIKQARQATRVPVRLPNTGSNSAEIARGYGLPKDFYKFEGGSYSTRHGLEFTPGSKIAINAKYRTREFDSAMERMDRASREGDGPRRRAAEKDMEAALAKIVRSAKETARRRRAAS